MSFCGDGIMQMKPIKSIKNKECDDGNKSDGDGCSSDCKIEKGYSCLINPKTLSSECKLLKIIHN